jgi:UDP-glucuronate decarboxylase
MKARNSLIEEGLRDVVAHIPREAFERRKVLVTGGAGFLGSWLCDALIELGANVTCIDNLSTGRAENIQHLLNYESFSFVKTDICEWKPSERFNLIIHGASIPSPDDYMSRPAEAMLPNGLGLLRLLEEARKSDSTLLFTSTSEVYGDAKVIPTPEDYWGNVNPIGPRSCFSEDMEVLTRDGWKFFKDITKDDEILTLNTQGRLEYQKPLEIVRERYCGELFRFKNTKVDLLVTPNHKMYVRVRGESSFKLIPAFEAIRWERAEMLKGGCEWVGEEVELFKLPQVGSCKREIKEVKMDDWLEFLGYFITEGSTYVNKRTWVKNGKKYVSATYTICISQSKKNASIREKIKKCLSRLGLKFYEEDTRFRI